MEPRYPFVAVDVSPDGMRVVTDVDLSPDDELIVSFQATPLGLWFDTGARVARLIRANRA